MTEKKKPVDWESIEADYRAGVKSLRVMSAEYGVSHVAIKKRADREGWTRDLSAKIKAATEAKVNRAAVNSEVNADEKVSEKAVIEATSETQKDVILGHRQDIARARKLAMSLLNELEGESADPELLSALGELVYPALKEETDAKLATKTLEAFRKASSLPGRVATMKALAEALKNLIPMEREAFGIESKTPLDDALKASGIHVSFVAANGQK
jgi:hypothetical protein